MTRPKNSASISARASKAAILAAAFLLAMPCLAAEQPKAATPAVVAAAPTGVKIAVVDVQRILQESLAARSVQKQLETQRAKFQAEIAEREKQLHESDAELKELRNTNANDEKLNEREQQLRQRFNEMERDVQGKRHALDEGFTNSMGVVRNGLLDVVHEIAKNRGVQAVLLKQQALWYDPSLDMTDEVLAQLNARLIDVPVKIDLSAVTGDLAEDKPVQKAVSAKPQK